MSEPKRKPPMRHFEDDAPTIASCGCGGRLRRISAYGPARPIDCQCDLCLRITGVGPRSTEPKAKDEQWAEF